MQTELFDNLNLAKVEFIRIHGWANYKIITNMWYGVSSISDTIEARSYRWMNMIFATVGMMPLSTTASFKSVVEWDCMIFKKSIIDYLSDHVRDSIHKQPFLPMARFLTTCTMNQEVPIEIDRVSPPLDIILEYTYVVWKHDDKFEMYDRNLAPHGFNRRGFPTPPMFDVLTRRSTYMTKKEYASMIRSKNSMLHEMLWEQELKNNEQI